MKIRIINEIKLIIDGWRGAAAAVGSRRSVDLKSFTGETIERSLFVPVDVHVLLMVLLCVCALLSFRKWPRGLTHTFVLFLLQSASTESSAFGGTLVSAVSNLSTSANRRRSGQSGSSWRLQTPDSAIGHCPHTPSCWCPSVAALRRTGSVDLEISATSHHPPLDQTSDFTIYQLLLF